MDSILIEFLVGIYFVVLDSQVLFEKPVAVRRLIRFILGLVLVVLAFLHVSIIK